MNPKKRYRITAGSSQLVVVAVGDRIEMLEHRAAYAMELEDYAHSPGFSVSCQGLGVHHLNYKFVKTAKEISEQEFNREWRRLTAPVFKEILGDYEGVYAHNFKRRVESAPYFKTHRDPKKALEEIVAAELALRPVVADAVNVTVNGVVFTVPAAEGPAPERTNYVIATPLLTRHGYVYGPAVPAAAASEPCVCFGSRSRNCRAHPGE